MNSKLARKLRGIAHTVAQEDGQIARINIQQRAYKTGRRVMSSDGTYVDELAPYTTYTQINADGNYKAIYSSMKRAFKKSNLTPKSVDDWLDQANM